MTLFVDDPDFQLHVGSALDVLRTLPDESVHCVVTSPPYFGLRDYQTGAWTGGDPDHKHETVAARNGRGGSGAPGKQTEGAYPSEFPAAACSCGATRTDQQLGLEPTPEAYVARMVQVFREVRRVLRRDGTCWLNLGDSYANDTKWGGTTGGKHVSELHGVPPADWGAASAIPGLKAKDLVGIPWRVAFALQAEGWYLRSDIIWAKPNPMPESVTDRPTKSHEYLFLLTREARYFYDADAIREAYVYGDDGRLAYTGQTGDNGRRGASAQGPDGRRKTTVLGQDGSAQHRDGERWPNPSGRNARSVWEIATQPYAEAHFATFPEELPRRCIAAGTSEHGCCPVCGAPWERLQVRVKGGVEVEVPASSRHALREDGSPLTGDNRFDIGTRASWNAAQGLAERRDAGWRPSCECDSGDGGLTEAGATDLGSRSRATPPSPVASVVLDPFMGSGTVALVARKLGRSSIGIELNPEYAELAGRRLQQQSLFA